MEPYWLYPQLLLRLSPCVLIANSKVAAMCQKIALITRSAIVPTMSGQARREKTQPQKERSTGSISETRRP